MGLQPIDLSTIYSQMDKVAKYAASQNQVSQLASQQRQEKASFDQLEKSKTVQEAKEQSSTSGIKKDGSQGGSSGAAAGRQDKKNTQDEDELESAPGEFTDPRLGQHIDIRG